MPGTFCRPRESLVLWSPHAPCGSLHSLLPLCPKCLSAFLPPPLYWGLPEATPSASPAQSRCPVRIRSMADWRLPLSLWSGPGPEELCGNKLLRNHLSPSLSSMSQGILLRAACTPARFPDSNTHKAQQTIFISHSRDEPATQVVEPASSWRAHLIYGGGSLLSFQGN